MNNNNLDNLVMLNKLKINKVLKINLPKIKEIKDEKIILKTPVRNYSWDDLKVLSSI